MATKFHVQPPGPLGKKTCSNGLGHMTKITADPYMMILQLGMSIVYTRTIKIVQIITQGSS